MECKFELSIAVCRERYLINRYIMECKLVSNTCPHVKAIRLIDTLWNINLTEEEKKRQTEQD